MHTELRMKNIVLIGMPAVGKTTIGTMLARERRMAFLDTDDAIRKSCMATLPEIIARHGGENFLKIENAVLSHISVTDTVIATGGSAVYGADGMANLKRNGIVLYISISFEEIQKRLRRAKERGVVLKDGQSLKDLYDERCVLYAKYADYTVDETGYSPSETARLCSELLKTVKL